MISISYSLFITAICIISAVFIGLTISLVITNVSRQKNKKNCDDAVNIASEAVGKLNEYISNSDPLLSMPQRLDYTKSLLTFIDELVTTEIVNEKRFEITLDKPSKNLDIDNVIKNTSNKVFNALNKTVFVSSNNILTEEYLMTYIQKRSFIIAMQYLKTYVASQI